MVNISKKQKRMVKEKIKGVSNKEIGQAEYPNATPGSQAVLVSRELNKSHVAQYLEQTKLLALKEHNITWSRIIKPISDGLEAGIQVRNKDGELVATVPDLNTRLRASKQAAELLRVKEELDPEDVKKLATLPDVDEIQLIRLMKNK